MHATKHAAVIMSHPAPTLPDTLLRLQSKDGARIAVSLFGGQLCSWQTADGVERLFISPLAHWDQSHAIRGGVPIIFPQFGNHGDGPKHGIARTLPWVLLSSSTDGPDGASMRLGLTDSTASKKISALSFALTLDICFTGHALSLSLTVHNTGHNPLAFHCALHTYLRTSVSTASISGLQHKTYRDAIDAHLTKVDVEPIVLIDRGIDRLYLHVDDDIVLTSDAGIITVSQHGFTDAVLWNPWIDKTLSLTDCTPDDYLNFVCIEAALVDCVQYVPPGQYWHGAQYLRASHCASLRNSHFISPFFEPAEGVVS